jgi:hypothetical protein
VPDFAPNYTARYKVVYNDGQARHTQSWRYPGVGDGPELAAAEAVISAYYTAILPAIWSDFAFISGSYALKDSDVFLPRSPFTGTGGVDPTDILAPRRPRHKAQAISFVGRSNLGQRAIFYQYGFASGIGDSDAAQDYRMYRTEQVEVAAAIDALIGGGADLVASDGAAINWYPYANAKANDYWVGKVRLG